MQRYKLLNFFNLFGIFSIFFFVAFLATYFYSPVFKTNASESDNVTIGAEIEDVVSVALSSHELNFEFTPTPEGVFDSKYVDVSVKTNTFGGYELYFSSIDNDTDMVHDTVTDGTNDGTSGSTNPVTDVISSDFSGTTTGTNMASNKWGYSLDTTNPILDKEYSIIPTLNNRLTLANTSSSTPGTTETKRVYIGVKVNSTLKSGTYEKTLKFTGVAHESPIIETIHSITSMQEMTSTICSATTTPLSSAATLDTDGSHFGDASYVPSTTLTDIRDNNTYTIRKLADGNCYMSQDLRLVGPITLKRSTSNVASDFNLPASIYNWTATYTDAMVYDTGDTTLGAYYNYYAASAGTISGDSNTANADYSICPYGWKLPSQSQYSQIVSTYGITDDENGSAIMTRLGYSSTGYHSPSGTGTSTVNGDWWGSTAVSTTNRHYLYIAPNRAGNFMTNGNRMDGNSVRCVAQ